MTPAIVGAAECDLGQTGLSIPELLTQAVTRALEDAGLSLSDVDGLATTAHGRFPATQLADYLVLQPIWAAPTAAGGAVFVMYVARVAQAIQSGQCRVVVIAFASKQRSARSRRMEGEPNARAGLSHADIDVLQIYDSFTISVPLALEQLGFCAPGEALPGRKGR